MPILQWALTCNRVITDREINSVSYIDAVEEIGVSNFPFPFPPVCVSTLWRREGEKDALSVRVRIQDPSGQTILSFQTESPIPMTKKRHRLNVILGGVQIQGPGEYLIVVEQRSSRTAKWKQESLLPVDISRLVATKMLQQRRTARGAARRR